MVAAVSSTESGSSTTSPVLSVGDRLVRTAAATSDLGDTGRRRLDEDDPESLLLEAAPSGAADHGENVAGAVQAHEVAVGYPSEEAHRRVELGYQPLEPASVPAVPRDRDSEVGGCSPSSERRP